MKLSLEGIPVAALVVDANGRVSAANSSARKLLGISEDETVDRFFEDLVSEAVERPLPEYARIGSATYRLSEGPLSSGEVGARLVLLTDVTHLAEAHEEAKADVRSRAAFMGKLSHEVRSAVASMIGFADLLKESVSASNRDLAEVITMSGRHLIDTLNAVMDLSKIEFGDEDVEFVEVDVESHARERVTVLRREAEKKGLSLELKKTSEDVTALLNPIFLDRILHNLIDNAIKYTEAGRVEVELERREGRVWIYVADTGRGMDASFIPDLFEPFERERSREEDDGMGLGLAITRYLVELLDGQITACSTSGEGSTFTVSFPAAGSK